MVAKLKPSVLINTNPFLEAMNKERLNHKGYCDKIALSLYHILICKKHETEPDSVSGLLLEK
ncbi:hypothetical protein, partial [Escherichia coli]|uniref:hypothetical protein n=1 Tax=Escherichia coli TaxID=562 RepID=UPI001131D19C